MVILRAARGGGCARGGHGDPATTFEVVHRRVDRAAGTRQRADLLRVEVGERLGAAVERHLVQDRFLGGAGVEVLVVRGEQRHDMLVARIPDGAGAAAGFDRRDLPGPAGPGVDGVALAVERQRPDVLRRERREQLGLAALRIDRVDAPAGRRARDQRAVATDRQRRNPGGLQRGDEARLAAGGAGVDGVDPPLIAGAEVGGLAVGRKRAAPDERGVERDGARFHPRHDVAGGQHHARRCLPLLEILGGGLAK